MKFNALIGYGAFPQIWSASRGSPQKFTIDLDQRSTPSTSMVGASDFINTRPEHCLSEKLVAEAKHHFKVIAQMWGAEVEHFQKFISSSELFGMFWSNDSNELFTSSWTICVVRSKKASNTFFGDKSNWQFAKPKSEGILREASSFDRH